MTTFNLIDEPWVALRRSDGTVDELSLHDTFHRADEYQGLAGEIPTQGAAVLRLLLAILLRATSRRRTEDDAIDEWEAWWGDHRLPLDEIDAYLDAVHDRFGLFDPDQPFMQVGNLHTESGKTSGLSKLIADVPAGRPFFTTRSGSQINSLSFAEAARWLVHVQAFDPSGIKTGAVGDDRVRNGKGYPIGPAVTGNEGLVIIEGTTLLETLLLNLVLPLDPSADRPVWERPPQSATVDRDHPVPAGPADLMTWQSRRVRLIHDDDRVTDVLICNGDRVEWPALLGKEPMTAWRYSTPQSKKFGQDVFMPRTHRHDMAMWRGLEPLLLRHSRQSRTSLRPASLEWLANLQENEAIADDTMIRIRAVGVEYGSQSAVIDVTLDDAMPASIAVLGEERLGRTAVEAAAVGQESMICLANLASNLCRAAGNDDTGERDRAWATGYAALDPEFREWFSRLGPTSDTAEERSRWHERVRRVITAAGRQLCSDAGHAAAIGRVDPHSTSSSDDVMDTARAWAFFVSRLRKATPHAPGSPTPAKAASGKDQT